MIYHGIRLYAVDSRDVGTFGGGAKRATVKIYDGSCANTPRATLSGSMVRTFRATVPKFARDEIEAYLRTLLPSNDPYRLGGSEHWVMVTAPMDQVYIGPFDSDGEAEAWCMAHDAEGHGFDYRVLTSAEHAANVAEYGALRSYTPEEYANG